MPGAEQPEKISIGGESDTDYSAAARKLWLASSAEASRQLNRAKADTRLPASNQAASVVTEKDDINKKLSGSSTPNALKTQVDASGERSSTDKSALLKAAFTTDSGNASKPQIADKPVPTSFREDFPPERINQQHSAQAKIEKLSGAARINSLESALLSDDFVSTRTGVDSANTLKHELSQNTSGLKLRAETSAASQAKESWLSTGGDIHKGASISAVTGAEPSQGSRTAIPAEASYKSSLPPSALDEGRKQNHFSRQQFDLKLPVEPLTASKRIIDNEGNTIPAANKANLEMRAENARMGESELIKPDTLKADFAKTGFIRANAEREAFAGTGIDAGSSDHKPSWAKLKPDMGDGSYTRANAEHSILAGTTGPIGAGKSAAQASPGSVKDLPSEPSKIGSVKEAYPDKATLLAAGTDEKSWFKSANGSVSAAARSQFDQQQPPSNSQSGAWADKAAQLPAEKSDHHYPRAGHIGPESGKADKLYFADQNKTAQEPTLPSGRPLLPEPPTAARPDLPGLPGTAPKELAPSISGQVGRPLDHQLGTLPSRDQISIIPREQGLATTQAQRPEQQPKPDWAGLRAEPQPVDATGARREAYSLTTAPERAAGDAERRAERPAEAPPARAGASGRSTGEDDDWLKRMHRPVGPGLTPAADDKKDDNHVAPGQPLPPGPRVLERSGQILAATALPLIAEPGARHKVGDGLSGRGDKPAAMPAGREQPLAAPRSFPSGAVPETTARVVAEQAKSGSERQINAAEARHAQPGTTRQLAPGDGTATSRGQTTSAARADRSDGAVKEAAPSRTPAPGMEAHSGGGAPSRTRVDQVRIGDNPQESHLSSPARRPVDDRLSSGPDRASAGSQRAVDSAGSRRDGQRQAEIPGKEGAGARSPAHSSGEHAASTNGIPGKGSDGSVAIRSPQAINNESAGTAASKGTIEASGKSQDLLADGSGRAALKGEPGTIRMTGKLATAGNCSLGSGEKRSMTGAEIALAAMIAAAGAAHVRQDNVRIERKHKGNTGNTPPAQLEDTERDPEEGLVAPGFLPEFHVAGEAIALAPVKRLRLEAGDWAAALEKAEQAGDEAADLTAVLRRPTCLIHSTDTLVSLAEELFHDPVIAWLIADLNADRIKESRLDGKRVIEVKSREELTLPVWQDIVLFYRDRPADAWPENLVTVVVETQLDRELLDTTLAGVVGARQRPAPERFENRAPLTPCRQVTGSIPPAVSLKALASAGRNLSTFVSELPQAATAAIFDLSHRWLGPPPLPAKTQIENARQQGPTAPAVL